MMVVVTNVVYGSPMAPRATGLNLCERSRTTTLKRRVNPGSLPSGDQMKYVEHVRCVRSQKGRLKRSAPKNSKAGPWRMVIRQYRRSCVSSVESLKLYEKPKVQLQQDFIGSRHKIGDMGKVRTHDLSGVSRTRYRLRHTTPRPQLAMSYLLSKMPFHVQITK
ncbi:hypothetical protein Bbelb_240400 [Branchiostoma belcheri]|nr:hypothetical protein Bbelb_240400 [Branchiostoma belcheri]